jgi:class 3 adenylate cyclase/tetratricopeptide (TPR) repeat protein
VTACQQCGTENPDQSKFCSECGASLPAAVAEQRERRVVSTLFADLAGFTRRSESLDVEDVEGFLDPYFAVLREEVDRTGGLIAKFTGDGVMALFGALVAHEDDPERAVRCGLSICERVSDLAGELHVRVGITTGEAMVTLPADGHPDAIGDVINTAARLEAAAPTDGVLVDTWTYRATHRAIDYGEHEPISAKGKTEPVEVWVAQASRSIIPEQQRDQLPIVGREAETGALRDAFERSRREPSTQLVSIIGEPGIGKTRLVEDLYAYVGALPGLITWRRGRSLAYGEGVALWALGEMVKAQAGILESDSADVAGHKLREAVESLSLDDRDREWVARHLGPLVGLEAATSRSNGSRVEAFAAWRRFLEALAETGPTVLVFEDIHWADDALLDFIDLLAERSGGVPLLIVCTARPELLERRPGWAGGKTNTTTISLSPLSDEDTTRLVGGLLDQSSLPVDVQQSLLAQASGNPLYAQEYVRMLQDRSVLVRGDAGWTLDGTVTDPPESIQGIIAARLDTLSPDEKSLLQDAAVIGRTAWIGAVCALSERNLWEADELLHGLERKQLVQRIRRSSIQGETEFTFGHELTKDVAYSQIRRADRAQKHEAAAAWIERLAGERDDKAELLADHYTRALSLREALGESTDVIAPRALAAFTDAATQAAATHAHAAAAHYYEAALALTPPDDSRRSAMLLLGQATALFTADGATPEILQAAIDAQITVEDWDAAAQVERMLGRWLRESGRDPEGGYLHLIRAAAYAARMPPTETTCLIASNQATAMFDSGQPAKALTVVSEVIPLAEQAGLTVGRALLLVQRGRARVALGDADGIRDAEEAAETLAREAHPQAAAAYGNLADTLRGLGHMAEADPAIARALQWATRFALPFVATLNIIETAVQAYHAAQWETTDELLTQAAATDPNPFNEHIMRAIRARMLLARGDTKAALQESTLVITYGQASGSDDLLFEGRACEARCHHSLGNDQASLEACSRFLTHWNDGHARIGDLAIALCELTPVLAGADRHDDIRLAALQLPEICRWRDALLLTADAGYAEAAERYTEIGSQPLAADSHILAAHQATRQGRTADAAAHAEAVLTFAAETGGVLYQRQAELLIAASA